MTHRHRARRVSTAEVFARPFSSSGGSFTCHRSFAKWSFHAVNGATSRIGNVPTASELTTTTGLVFRISAPTVGSKFTSQTLPRRTFIHESPACQSEAARRQFARSRLSVLRLDVPVSRAAAKAEDGENRREIPTHRSGSLARATLHTPLASIAGAIAAPVLDLRISN